MYMVKKSRIKRISPTLERFLDEYAPQICLDGMEYDLPDWVFDYREEQIRRIGKNGKALYQRLKDIGVDFKVKYPVERSGRWKFADAYLPNEGLYILLMNSRETYMPACSMYDRAVFFGGRDKCLEILPEEVWSLEERIRKAVNDRDLSNRKAI